MGKPKSKHNSLERLKSYVALQLQAYYRRDWEVYDRLEQKIRRLEEHLAQ